eukprot:20137-Amphidinium_carterae.1
MVALLRPNLSCFYPTVDLQGAKTLRAPCQVAHLDPRQPWLASVTTTKTAWLVVRIGLSKVRCRRWDKGWQTWSDDASAIAVVDQLPLYKHKYTK